MRNAPKKEKNGEAACQCAHQVNTNCCMSRVKRRHENSADEDK